MRPNVRGEAVKQLKEPVKRLTLYDKSVSVRTTAVLCAMTEKPYSFFPIPGNVCFLLAS